MTKEEVLARQQTLAAEVIGSEETESGTVLIGKYIVSDGVDMKTPGTPLESDYLFAVKVGTDGKKEYVRYKVSDLITHLGSDVTEIKGEIVDLQTAINSTVAQAESDISAGLSQVNTAKANALTAIGEDNQSGARGDALSEIADAKSAALSAIGETDTAGARGEALEAIAAKETQVNSDLDSKLASANSTIDGKVSAAEESASAAAGSASDASGSAELALQWASNPEDTPVTGEGATAKYSSYHWAQKAEEAANSPLASESSAGRIRATSNASYVRPEGMTEPVAYTVEAVNSIKIALQTDINTLEGKFAFIDSSYEAVVTPEQTA